MTKSWIYENHITAEWRITWRKIIAVTYATFAVAKKTVWKKKKKKRKNSGSYVIRYRYSALSIKPTGNRSLNWFVINPWKLRMMTKLWIYEKYICELRSEELYEERSSQFYTQILQLRKESLKKPEFFFQAFFSQLQKFVYNCDDFPSYNWYTVCCNRKSTVPMSGTDSPIAKAHPRGISLALWPSYIFRSRTILTDLQCIHLDKKGE